MVSEALQRLEDPLGAVGDRVDAMGPLVEELDDNPSAGEALFRLARETAELLGRTEFSHVPVLAGRLRTQVFFIARGTDEERASAVGECDRLLASIRQRFQGGSEAGPRVKPDTEKSP